MLEHAAEFAILAFAQTHGEPGVAALGPIEARTHRTIMDTIDGDPLFEGGKTRRIDRPMNPYPIAAQPSGGGKLEPARELSVIGEKEKSFRSEIEPSHRNQSREVGGQFFKDGRPSLLVAM